MVIHVRSITNAEGNTLRTIVRHPKYPIELRRAQVVLSSAQGFTLESTSPQLPVVVTLGSTASISIVIGLPKGGYSGTLSIEIWVT